MAGISPKLPLKRSPEDGYWALNKTFLEVTKQNFKNLILTIPGEKIMNPSFGVGLITFLFAQEGVDVEGDIAAKIKEQVKRYMPHVALINIEFSDRLSELEKSSNLLNIRVVYRIIPLNQDDILDISIDPDKQSLSNEIKTLL